MRRLRTRAAKTHHHGMRRACQALPPPAVDLTQTAEATVAAPETGSVRDISVKSASSSTASGSTARHIHGRGSPFIRMIGSVAWRGRRSRPARCHQVRHPDIRTIMSDVPGDLAQGDDPVTGLLSAKPA